MEYLNMWVAAHPGLAALATLMLLMLVVGLARYWNDLRIARWVQRQGQYQLASPAFVEEAKSDARERGVGQQFDQALAVAERLHGWPLRMGHVIWAMDVAEGRTSIQATPPSFLASERQ